MGLAVTYTASSAFEPLTENDCSQVDPPHPGMTHKVVGRFHSNVAAGI